LRNNVDKLVIGTWNVKTLLKPGKIQELSEELHKSQMNIVALQEIRWAGNGVISKKYFQLFYSGAKKSGQAGIIVPSDLPLLPQMKLVIAI
jgi:exonuclease III